MTARIGQGNGIAKRVAETEEQFLQAVIAAAKALSWDRIYHTRDSRRSDSGWPDLCLVRPPRLLFLELKMPGRQLTPAQRAWLQDLQACNQEAFVCYPKDWDNLIEFLRQP